MTYRSINVVYNFKKGHLYMLFTIIIWGVGSLVISTLVNKYRSIGTILFWRYLTATIAFATGVLIVRSFSFVQFKDIIKRPLAWGIALGLSIGTLYPLFLAFSHTAPGLIMLIWNLAPLLGMVIGKFIFNDRFNKTEVISTIMVALASIALSTLRYPLSGANILGILYALCSVGFYILSTSLTRAFIGSKYAEELNILSSVAGAIGAVIIYVLSPNKVGIFKLVYIKDWGIWYLGILSTVVAQTLATRASYLIDYSEGMVYTYLQSLIVIILESVTSIVPSTLNLYEWLLIVIIVIAFVTQLRAARKGYKDVK